MWKYLNIIFIMILQNLHQDISIGRKVMMELRCHLKLFSTKSLVRGSQTQRQVSCLHYAHLQSLFSQQPSRLLCAVRDVQCNTNKSPSMIHFPLTYSITQKWCSLLINLKKITIMMMMIMTHSAHTLQLVICKIPLVFPLQNIIIHT